jgi:hypothetical protein
VILDVRGGAKRQGVVRRCLDERIRGEDTGRKKEGLTDETREKRKLQKGKHIRAASQIRAFLS